MLPVPEVSGLDCAFGSIKHLPAYEAIPEEFKSDHNPFVKLQQKWFFTGLDGDEIKPKKGVVAGNAFAALRAIQSSYEPRHEHKQAGVAYLMSQWFDIRKDGK